MQVIWGEAVVRRPVHNPAANPQPGEFYRTCFKIVADARRLKLKRKTAESEEIGASWRRLLRSMDIDFHQLRGSLRSVGEEFPPGWIQSMVGRLYVERAME